MDIQLVIFDFDGTLGDTRRNIVMTMQQTMEALQLPVADESAVAATIGLPLETCFKVLYDHLSDADADRCARTYRDIFEVNRQRLVPGLFPHVAETLAELSRRGLMMAVASSRGRDSLCGFLQSMGIADGVGCVLGADDVTHAKPHPEPVLKILAATGVEAERTLVVGDMPVDILMGKGAGTHTCGVSYGNGERSELLKAGADYVIDDMSELLTLL